MSELREILAAAKNGLSPWEPIPQSKWSDIAAQCGPEEVKELRERIASLRAELKTVEEWDGDTQDDINKAINFFRELLSLATRKSE